MTLIDILDLNAGNCPQKTAIKFDGTKYSYSSVRDKVFSFANFLIDIGLKKGGRVGCIMDSRSPELLISFLGIAAAGGVVVPIDYNQTINQVNQLLNLVSPYAIVVSDKLAGMVPRLNVNLLYEKIIVTGDSVDSNYIGFNDIISRHPKDKPGIDIQENDVVYFNLTSGTTGLPKCAVTTHANIYWNTVAAVESLNLTEKDVHLCMFPPSVHPHEFFARSLFLGGTTVLTDSISPKTLTKVIEKNHVTCMMAIAPIYGNLVHYHARTDFYFKGLRIAESGGMHVNPVLAEQFIDRFNIPIVPVWGSTETTGIALAMPVDGDYREGSCGKVCPYYQAKIVDENGAELRHGLIGELIIRGPGVCSEYFANQDVTTEQFKNGWYQTGDMFRKDSEGYYYFEGRKFGMMKVAGLKVSPVEIENVLIRHPDIKEVAVIGVKNDLYGEVPKAVIVLKNNLVIDKKEIIAFCKDKLAKYKVPKVIEIKDSLPRTPGGKILIKDLYAENF